MRFNLITPINALFLFLQSLFLYLHYSTHGFWAEDHWGVYFLPTFVGLVLLVVSLISEGLAEGRQNAANEQDGIPPKETSYVLFQVLTAVLLLFSLTLYVFYLDEDTDLPIYWITSCFFLTTILFSVTLVLIYNSEVAKANRGPYNQPAPGALRSYLFVAFLAFVQGLLIWVKHNQWKFFDKMPQWVVALPCFIFLASSFYRTLSQTHQKRNEDGGQFIKQCSFLFLILLTGYVVLAYVIHKSNPDIAWTQPKWIVLPFMVYSIILFCITIYIYWMNREGFSIPHPKRDLEEMQSYETNEIPPPPYTPLPNSSSYSPSQQSYQIYQGESQGYNGSFFQTGSFIPSSQNMSLRDGRSQKGHAFREQEIEIASHF